MSHDLYQQSSWKVLQKLLPTKGVRSSTDEIKSDDGTTVCDGKAIANVINKFFANIGNKLADKITPTTDFHTPDILPSDNPFTMRLIDVVFVRIELKALDMTKSTGIDGIPTTLLKASAPSSGRALSSTELSSQVQYLESGKQLELHQFTRRVTNEMIVIRGLFQSCQLS